MWTPLRPLNPNAEEAMGRFQVWALAAACLFLAPVRAQQIQDVPADDPVHQQLRAVKDKMVEAFNKRDVEGLLQYLHPDVVVTWQNGEVSRKHEGVRQYYQKMLLGPSAIVDSVSIDK